MPEGNPLGNLLLTFILILVNAFFAMSEIAVITFSDVKLKRLAAKGNSKAKILVELTENESRFLSTIQVGVTLAGFFSSAVAADSLTEYVVYWLRNLPISVSTLRTISLVIITLLLSFFTLIFGELVPKRIAMNNPEKMSFFAAWPLKITSVVTAPFVWLLSVTTNGVLKLIGINPEDADPNVTEEEIRMMLDAGEKEGTIEEDKGEMIHNIFDLDDTEVSDVMTHRTELVFLDEDDSLERAIELVLTEGHSRFPVCRKNLDKIIGFLLVKDLFALVIDPPAEFHIKDYMRQMPYFPESMPLKDAFKNMKSGKHQMAVVVDEYGGTAGIVTMEDILETIVGDIEDEYDNEEEEINEISEGVFILDGTTLIWDVEEELEINLPNATEDYDTIAGYVVDRLGRIPDSGEHPVIEVAGYSFKVLGVEGHRIETIEAKKLELSAK